MTKKKQPDSEKKIKKIKVLKNESGEQKLTSEELDTAVVGGTSSNPAEAPIPENVQVAECETLGFIGGATFLDDAKDSTFDPPPLKVACVTNINEIE